MENRATQVSRRGALNGLFHVSFDLERTEATSCGEHRFDDCLGSGGGIAYLPPLPARGERVEVRGGHWREHRRQSASEARMVSSTPSMLS